MASQPLADPKKEEQRQKFLQQIRETGTVPSTMSVSTSSATGRYRLRESLILPGQEYHVTGTCVENPDARDAHDRNMIVLGQNEKTFLISWKPEQEVRHGLRNRALGMVFGGAALALFCLALLFVAFESVLAGKGHIWAGVLLQGRWSFSWRRGFCCI